MILIVMTILPCELQSKWWYWALKVIKEILTTVICCSDLDKLKEGIGEKLSIFTYLVMSFTISVIFSFFYGWKLTLVILSCAPIIILATAIVAKVCPCNSES